jgi:hypothetical protein
MLLYVIQHPVIDKRVSVLVLVLVLVLELEGAMIQGYIILCLSAYFQIVK